MALGSKELVDIVDSTISTPITQVFFNTLLLGEIASNMRRTDLFSLVLTNTHMAPAIPLLWRWITISSGEQLERLLSVLESTKNPRSPWLCYGEFVQELVLQQDFEMRILMPSKVLGLFSYFPNLRAIKTEDIPLPEPLLLSLAASCHNISSIHFLTRSIHTPALPALALANPYLAQLTLTTDLLPHVAEPLCNNLRTLHTLTLQGDPASHTPPTRLISSNPQLRSLSLSTVPLPDSSLHAITKLQELRSLSITSPSHVGGPALRETLRLVCGNGLTHLALTNLPNFGSEDLARLAPSCRSLQALHLVRCAPIPLLILANFVRTTPILLVRIIGDIVSDADAVKELLAAGELAIASQGIVFKRHDSTNRVR